MTQPAVNIHVLNAQIMEKDEEIAYLRGRNTTLSITIQTLSAEVSELRAKLKQSEPEPEEVWEEFAQLNGAPDAA